MTVFAFYNEIDPYAAQWLRNLIAAGDIADGYVDERSIEDIEPYDLRGFTQVHLFAGIGVWSLALRRSGWPDDRPIWTGSCPCQPFSEAGKGGGFADERHLWPAYHHLVRECRPHVVAGEQVASKDGLAWFDLVQSDLEGEGYAAGAVDTCVAGFGAPHIRQRLHWVAYLSREQRGPGRINSARDEPGTIGGPARLRPVSGVDHHHHHHPGSQGFAGHGHGGDEPRRLDAGTPGSIAAPSVFSGLGDLPGGRLGVLGNAAFPRSSGHPDGASGLSSRMADSTRGQLPQSVGGQEGGKGAATAHDQHRRPGPVNGLWSDVDWLFCRDGKWRPVEPSTFPLVDGASFGVGSRSAYAGKSRQGMLKGYGNAVTLAQTEEFMRAVRLTLDGPVTLG